MYKHFVSYFITCLCIVDIFYGGIAVECVKKGRTAPETNNGFLPGADECLLCGVAHTTMLAEEKSSTSMMLTRTDVTRHDSLSTDITHSVTMLKTQSEMTTVEVNVQETTKHGGETIMFPSNAEVTALHKTSPGPPIRDKGHTTQMLMTQTETATLNLAANYFDTTPRDTQTTPMPQTQLEMTVKPFQPNVFLGIAKNSLLDQLNITETEMDPPEQLFAEISTTSEQSVQNSFAMDKDTVDEDIITDTLLSRKHIISVIIRDYDRRIRPVVNQMQNMIIASRFYLVGILNFDSQLQVIDVYGYFRFEWIDHIIKRRNTSIKTTTGEETISIPISDIWGPSITISKAIGKRSSVGSINTDLAYVADNGMIEWVPEGVFRVLCEVNAKFYPFDEQTCTMTYFTSGEAVSRVHLLHVGDVNTTYYYENAEWSLLRVSHKRRLVKAIAYIDVRMTFKRRAGFGLLTMIVPPILLSSLSCSTFLIPSASGEKLGVSMAILLAYGIYLSIVQRLLPRNSLQIPYYVIYIDCKLFLALVLSFYSIIQSKLLHDKAHLKCRVWIYIKARCNRFRGLPGNLVDHDLAWAVLLRKIDNWMFYIFAVVHVAMACSFLAISTTSKLN